MKVAPPQEHAAASSMSPIVGGNDMMSRSSLEPAVKHASQRKATVDKWTLEYTSNSISDQVLRERERERERERGEVDFQDMRSRFPLDREADLALMTARFALQRYAADLQ